MGSGAASDAGDPCDRRCRPDVTPLSGSPHSALPCSETQLVYLPALTDCYEIRKPRVGAQSSPCGPLSVSLAPVNAWNLLISKYHVELHAPERRVYKICRGNGSTKDSGRRTTAQPCGFNPERRSTLFFRRCFDLLIFLVSVSAGTNVVPVAPRDPRVGPRPGGSRPTGVPA